VNRAELLHRPDFDEKTLFDGQIQAVMRHGLPAIPNRDAPLLLETKSPEPELNADRLLVDELDETRSTLPTHGETAPITSLTIRSTSGSMAW